MSSEKGHAVRNVLLGMLVLAIIFFLGFVPWYFSTELTTHRFHFPDPNDGKTPASFGMPDYHSIEFQSSDGVPLKGWYSPAGPKARGTIVYCHGRSRTRIEMLPMAAYGRQLGYNALLFDFRMSGQSGGSKATLGYKERLDAIAAVHYALNQEHAQRPIVLWGVSMGAAAALMAASDSPDVNAVISDSSFLSYKHVIVHHAHLYFGIPSFPIVDETIDLASWRGGFDPADFDLRKAVKRINPRPVLFIAVAGDRRITPAIARQLYSDSTSPKSRLLIVPGKRHGEGFKSGNQQYEQAVKRFLDAVASDE